MTKSYVVKQGDSLSIIAGREYGDIQLWPLLAQANPAITNPNVIQPGQVITIPDLNDAVEVQAEVIESKPGLNALSWAIWILLVGGGIVIYKSLKKSKGKDA